MMYPLNTQERAKYIQDLPVAFRNGRGIKSSKEGLVLFNALWEITDTAHLPCRHIKKIDYCCGVLNLDNWVSSVTSSLEAAFHIFIDNMVKLTENCHSAGIIVSTTNNHQPEAEALLLRAGFTGVNFYNASSGGHMTMWTLILFPEKGVTHVK